MANLLTAKGVDWWQNDMRARLIVATCTTLTGCALLIIGSLLPEFFAVRVDVAMYTHIDTETSAQKSSRTERDEVLQIKKRIRALEKIGKTQKISAAVTVVVAEKPEGMVLNSLSYTHRTDGGTLDVAGTVKERTMLKTYADALRGKDPLNEVSVPISAFAKAGGGDFSLSLTGDF
ncbi:MAG: hypothetical protein AAB421_01695 [Patescibacteria group bacterium]